MLTGLSSDMLLWWTLKGSVIAALALASTTLLRNRPAAVRHAIWTIAVLAQLVLPIGDRLIPRRAALEVPVPVRALSAPPASVSIATPSKAVTRTATPIRFDPLQVALAIGTSLLLLRLLAGTLRVMFIARGAARVVEGEWLSLVQRIGAAFRIRRPITLLCSDRVHVPVTWGFIYPTILLPSAARDWPADLRRHVLLHELAHVRRGDALTQVAAQLAVALFWFNPLVWLASHRMRSEAENACDDYVLRDGERPSVYAATLVRLVRAHAGRELPAFASLSVGRRSDLEHRIGAITHPRRDPSIRRSMLGGAVAAALLVVLPLSAVQRAVQAARQASNIDCRPVVVRNAPFSETSGTLTQDDGTTTHYFFLRPAADRCIEASFSMDTRFTSDDRDVVPDPGVDALVREKLGNVDRMVVTNELKRRYTVNGRPESWDTQAERWYRSIMPEIIRRSSAGVGDRARRILDRGGIDAFVAELSRIPMTGVRRDYLEALLSLRTAAELPRRRVIEIAQNALTDYEPDLANFLAPMATREAADPAVRAEILEATAAFDDGSNRDTVIEAMTKHRDPAVRIAALDAIDLLPGDVWRRTVLERSAPSYLGRNTQLVDAYFAALDKLRSKSEKRMLLATLQSFESEPDVGTRIEHRLATTR